MSKVYRIHFAKAAETDLMNIVTYIAEQLQEPDAARTQYFRIKHEITSLRETPKRIPLVRDERLAHDGYRIMRVDNYHVFFVISDEQQTVTIARILYARRNWANLL